MSNIENESRAQFEAWYAIEHPSRMKTLRWEPEYQSYKQQFDDCMFSAWQASRQALAIELPSVQCIRMNDYTAEETREACRRGIESQGVKCK